MVNKDDPMDGIADFLVCLGNLERKNSQLFENLAKKTVLPSVKQQLSKIAQDNESHAEILTGMSEQIGNTKIKTKDCKNKLSTVCETTEAILEQVSKKEKITAKELSDFLSTLESSGGAMQYMIIQAETFLFMSKEISRLYGMDFKEFNDHLIGIAQQVEEHIEILEEVKAKIAEHNPKEEQHHPIFRYQTPDAW